MSVDDVTKLVDMLKTAGGYGVAGVFIWLYVNERNYSRTLIDRIATITTDALKLSTTVDSLKSMLKDMWDSFK